ncbi:MAG: hypothetical protein RIR70_2238 [Pseudomonadota bacterium]|jgi:hypothetical protein
MIDDFAAKGGVSTLSAGGEVSVLEAPFLPQSLDATLASRQGDDLDYDDLAPPSHAPQTQFEAESASPPQATLSHTPAHDGLTVHVCRGTGDGGYIDALIAALIGNGWSIESSSAANPASNDGPVGRREPGGLAFNDGNIHVALGLGLGGAHAMWCGKDGRLGAMDGVVAVCPFLGFDAPIYRSNQKRVGRLQERAFALAGQGRWRSIAARVECVGAYCGLGNFASQPISWADVVDCAPHLDFTQLMSQLTCPHVLILDAEDPELDADRAKSQIPAMSVLASADIRVLGDSGLLHAVEHALYSIIRHHREGRAQAASPANPIPGNHPL